MTIIVLCVGQAATRCFIEMLANREGWAGRLRRLVLHYTNRPQSSCSTKIPPYIGLEPKAWGRGVLQRSGTLQPAQPAAHPLNVGNDLDECSFAACPNNR